MCEEYSADHDISLYLVSELIAMLRYYDGKSWTIPPFSKDEIEYELAHRLVPSEIWR